MFTVHAPRRSLTKRKMSRKNINKGKNLAVHLILMILAVVFTFIDQKRMLKQGRCIWLTENGTILVWKFAFAILVLALVLEALFLFINISAAMDFFHLGDRYHVAPK